MDCSDHRNSELAHCPQCLALYWKTQYEMLAAAPRPKTEPRPIPTSIDMDRMLYAYKLLPDDVKQQLSLNMLAELRKALNLTFIPTPDDGKAT